MANQVTWVAPTNRTMTISAQGTAAAAGILGAEVDNETNQDRYIAFELTVDFDTTPPIANRAMLVYILYSLDGTIYENGSASLQPQKAPAAVFPVKALTTEQIYSSVGIPLAPFKFKVLLWNDTDQATGTTSNTVLDAETYNEDIQ